jgi:ribosomal protein S18 acetylase RimI-like enzyme
VSEKGVGALFLEVQTTNKNARNFYKKRGFKETGKIISDYYPDGGDAIIMKKRIDRRGQNRLSKNHRSAA